MSCVLCPKYPSKDECGLLSCVSCPKYPSKDECGLLSCVLCPKYPGKDECGLLSNYNCVFVFRPKSNDIIKKIKQRWKIIKLTWFDENYIYSSQAL